ncbi:MAG: hypothetical protein RIC14_15940 [Filomicrobium sp.]
MRFVAVVLVFFLLGPPIGGIALMSPVFASALMDTGVSGSDIAGDLFTWLEELAALLLFVGLFSFAFGGLAALLCGLWIAWRSRAGRVVTYVECLLAGAAGGFLGDIVLSLAMRATGGEASQAEVYVTMIMFLVPSGVVAALVCLWLCRRMGLVARTPLCRVDRGDADIRAGSS